MKKNQPMAMMRHFRRTHTATRTNYLQLLLARTTQSDRSTVAIDIECERKKSSDFEIRAKIAVSMEREHYR